MKISGFVEYVKQIWKNKPDTSTPVSAERLNHIEEGIKANSDALAALAAVVCDQVLNDPEKIASLAALYSVDKKIGNTANLPNSAVDVVTALTTLNSNYETLNSSKLDREVFVSVYNYLTTSNIDTIFRGIYWVNGYGGISGDLPFTNCHYMLIATANEMQSSRMQLAISLSDKSIKFRYYAGTSWTAWQ